MSKNGAVFARGNSANAEYTGPNSESNALRRSGSISSFSVTVLYAVDMMSPKVVKGTPCIMRLASRAMCGTTWRKRSNGCPFDTALIAAYIT